jgi:hypothetical protein
VTYKGGRERKEKGKKEEERKRRKKLPKEKTPNPPGNFTVDLPYEQNRGHSGLLPRPAA